MREDALNLLAEVDEKGLAYIFHRSEPKAVILSIKDFIFLQEALENLQDFKDAKSLAEEKRGGGVPLKSVAKKYV